MKSARPLLSSGSPSNIRAGRSLRVTVLSLSFFGLVLKAIATALHGNWNPSHTFAIRPSDRGFLPTPPLSGLWACKWPILRLLRGILAY